MGIRRTHVEAAAAAVLLLAATSCSESPSRPGVPPLTTHVTVSPAVTAAGGAFEVGVEVEVRGRAVDLTPPCEELLGYRIRAADGTVVAEYPGPDCAVSLKKVHLAVGDTRTARLDVSTLLYPGDYEVEAGLTGLEDDYPWATTALHVMPPSGVFAIQGTLSIDSYTAQPPEYEYPTRLLAGQSTDFIAMFDSASAVRTNDVVVGDLIRVRSSYRVGFSSRWAFTNPVFGSVWGAALEGHDVTFSATSLLTLESGVENRGLLLDVDMSDDWSMHSDYDFAVDGDGIPILEPDMPLIGTFTSFHFVVDINNNTWVSATIKGTADATALNVGPEPVTNASLGK